MARPALSATQTLRINVLDTQSDFTLSIGTTNTPSGTTNSVPILLSSHADLTNITFQLELPVARLGSFTLQPAAAAVASAVLIRCRPIAHESRLLASKPDPAERHASGPTAFHDRRE